MAKATGVVEIVGREGGLVDTSIGTVHTKSHSTSYVFAGIFFTAKIFNLSILDDASLAMLVRVPSGEPIHWRLEGAAGGDAELRLSEFPTVTSPGIVTAAMNRNRVSTKTANAIHFDGPTFSDEGLLLAQEFAPGGEKKDSPGATKDFDEWILAPGDYLVQWFNRSDAAAPMSLTAFWYEPLQLP